tara:strand:+ start:340 stop:609 length:270 start_codon:yes stop_codon:yes gene_type:complete
MADADYYTWLYEYNKEYLGKGVMARVQYKEVIDDMDNSIEHEINLGCASQLMGDLDDNLIGVVFFETEDADIITQIKNHSDIVEHINTY